MASFHTPRLASGLSRLYTSFTFTFIHSFASLLALTNLSFGRFFYFTKTSRPTTPGLSLITIIIINSSPGVASFDPPQSILDHPPNGYGSLHTTCGPQRHSTVPILKRALRLPVQNVAQSGSEHHHTLTFAPRLIAICACDNPSCSLGVCMASSLSLSHSLRFILGDGLLPATLCGPARD